MSEEKFEKARTPFFFYASVLPAVLVFTILLLFPLIYEIYAAFITRDGAFTLGNIVTVINDPLYTWSLIRMIIYIVVDISIKFGLGLITAAAFKQEFLGRGVVTALALAPWAVPLIPALFAWYMLYNPDFGVINYALHQLGLIKAPYMFLNDPNTALYWIIWAHAWRYTPMWTTMLLSGLYAIPEEYYESAKIDGATPFRTFIKITIPMLKRFLLMNAVLSLIWTSGEFASVWVMTRGGPGNATQIVGTYAYWYLLFIGNSNVAAAALVVALPIIIALMLIFMRLVGGRR
ncbi:MAG: carbohydrate ABC transporter permease [Nitrososphaeria archaeon]